jgi:hypothetical protein
MGHKKERRRALFLSTAIAQATTHIQFPIQGVLLALSPKVNWPESETNSSTSYNPKDMNTSALTQVYDRCLMKDKNNFTLT